MFVERADKRALLCAMLRDPALARVLVFTRTKHGANRLAEQLGRAGFGAEAIHGNKSQGARQRALEEFRAGTVRVLVATDIAARGIDIDAISHVINYELPNVPETYVHRIGRTARAGASGRRDLAVRHRGARLSQGHRAPDRPKGAGRRRSSVPRRRPGAATATASTRGVSRTA